MKNKWMKKILVLMMCGALAVPAAGMAQPMVAQATSPATGREAATPSPTPSPSASPDKTTESLKDAKTNIAAQLDDYYAALESSIPDDKKSAAAGRDKESEDCH